MNENDLLVLEATEVIILLKGKVQREGGMRGSYELILQLMSEYILFLLCMQKNNIQYYILIYIETEGFVVFSWLFEDFCFSCSELQMLHFLKRNRIQNWYSKCLKFCFKEEEGLLIKWIKRLFAVQQMHLKENNLINFRIY